jgi:hypothetical protein
VDLGGGGIFGRDAAEEDRRRRSTVWARLFSARAASLA